MSKIIDLFGKFNSEEEKDAFMEAQFSTITQLTKQVDELKTKNKSLEDLISKSVPIVGEVIQKEGIFSSEEEAICREQLRLLKETSKDRELTLEETRKVEIYSKILFQNKNSVKKVKSPVDDMSPEQLLKIVKDGSEKS